MAPREANERGAAAQQNGHDAGGGGGSSVNQGHKVVGPNITGTKEEYRLERKLQSGLFGGVYEAKGLSSGKLFAVKVLHFSEIAKASQADQFEFCEVPLREIEYLEEMRGSDYIMEVEDHFQDKYCHYIVFPLAPGGDLLEALKLRPNGFEESQAQFMIAQAAKGLSVLHQRRLAMQDVSLENMLISYLEDGQFQIKICDPGQATLFEVNAHGEELPVQFNGFVGKSFRPPELHQQQPYYASKVDAWCLGWSTFYLLAAQPLFLSADPAQQDTDWAMFHRGEVKELFHQKGAKCSAKCMDFILKLMHLDPNRRLSVAEALQHDWLTDPTVRPMYEPRALKTARAKPVFSQGSVTNIMRVQEGGSSVASGSVGASAVGASGSLQAAAGRNASGLSPDAGRAGRFRNTQPGSNRAVQPVIAATAASTRAASRGQVPAWKMTAVSRSESPSPGNSTTGSAALGLRPRQQQTPAQQPQQLQAPRAASPFTWTAPRDESIARQLGTPRRPEPTAARGLASLRSLGGGGGSASLQSSTLHHTEGGNRSSQQYAVPAPTPTAPGSEGGNSPAGNSPTGYSGASAPLVGSGGNAAASGDAFGHGAGASAGPVASRATSGANGRQQQLATSLGDAGHGNSSGGLQTAQRTGSPLQTQIVIRAGTNGRGYSPGPGGTLGSAPLGTLGNQLQHRTGSPMQQHSGNAQVPTVISGTSRATVSGSALIDPGSGGHYWQSPRAASPGSTVIRANEAFARGRSSTRASSPSQVTSAHSPTPLVNTYGGNPTSPHGFRGVSPNTVGSQPTLQSRVSGTSGGMTWQPAPLSPPPNKRAVSPVPSPVYNCVPKWVQT